MTPTGSIVDRSVYRPVQYLGSKLRVLPQLRAAVSTDPGPQTVWEPFAGSSVVGQSLAAAGHRVIAWDALASSATFAQALLGVGQHDGDTDVAPLRAILPLSREIPTPTAWSPWLAKERDALHAKDGQTLLGIGRTMPQGWRNAPKRLIPRDMGAPPALLSETFAGTYFGLRQALRLERLRAAIDLADERAGLSPWSRAVALTALCAAASTAVFSAGKHFAQPHRVPEGKDSNFHARRALHDRSVDVDQVFQAAVQDICLAARPSSERHEAGIGRVENATVDDLRRRGVSTVYADPPYTAQQYSRFYHLLETLISGQVSTLQLVKGEVTRGLYPDSRYLSPFCSRRQAPAAFIHLAAIARQAGARLVLSYSATANQSGQTGNARTVTLSDLVAFIRTAYPHGGVTVTELDVRYRQFNQQGSAIPGRDDPEYLIIGDPDAR